MVEGQKCRGELFPVGQMGIAQSLWIQSDLLACAAVGCFSGLLPPAFPFSDGLSQRRDENEVTMHFRQGKCI